MYGVVRYTISSVDYALVYKKNTYFENGGDAKIQAVVRDADASEMAVGNSLAIAPDSTFLILGGILDYATTHYSFLAYISEASMSITNTYQYTNMKNFHSLIISDDSTRIFAVGRDQSSVGVLWTFSTSSPTTGECRTFTSSKILSLTHIKSTSTSEIYYFSLYEQTLFKMVKETFVSGTGTSTNWVSQINYSGYGSLTTIRDKSLYHQSRDEIYILGLINTDKVFLTSLHQANGSVAMSIYVIDPATGASAIEITAKDKIYILVQLSTQHYIHIYDPETATLGTSFDNVVGFSGHAISLINDMIVVGGAKTSNSCGVFK